MKRFIKNQSSDGHQARSVTHHGHVDVRQCCQKTSNFFANLNFLYHKYFFLEPNHVKISWVCVHALIDKLFLYRFARLLKAQLASYFFQHDEQSKLGGGASWDVLFKWAKMKSVENECNELIMIGIGILCIFHSFPLKKCIREDFFVDFFDFQKKNTCYLNG